MSILRPLSIFLRNALIRQHPYFSCCASCGEIKTPVENRLCASLQFPFEVDAVILCDEHEKAATRISALERHCSWLRQIVVVCSAATAASGISRNERIRSVRPDEFMPAAAFGPEAYCQDIPDLGEYFLIVPSGVEPKRDLLPLDFFTPNGIPLLRLRKTQDEPGIIDSYSLAPGIMAQTRENAAAFLRENDATAPCGKAGYFAAAAGQAFAAGRVVPVKG